MATCERVNDLLSPLENTSWRFLIMSGDFIESLKGTLLNTLNPRKDVRQEAEDALASYLGVPNAFSGFLELACQTGDKSAHRGVGSGHCTDLSLR